MSPFLYPLIFYFYITMNDKHYHDSVTPEVLTASNIKTMALLDVTPCSLTDASIFRVRSLKMQAASSSEKLAFNHQN
jgi:hypothetical protein